MDKIYQFFDSHFKRNYLVFGQYKKLIPLISFRLLPRNNLDKLFLSLQFKFSFNLVNDALLKHSLNTLKILHPDSFIFLQTSPYKEADFIGLLAAQNDIFFLKHYKSYEESLFQESQFKFIQLYFSNYFKTLGIRHRIQNYLILPYINPKRSINESDNIESRLLSMNSEMMSAFKTNKNPSDVIPVDWKLIFSEQPDFVLKIQQWLKKQKNQISLIPIHGDMTPWNIIMNERDELVLLDYETAGWHVPFYDYHHYILQPLALKNNQININKIVQFDKENRQKHYLIIHLIDQIYKHLINFKQSDTNDKFLNRVIKCKTKWLNELLDEE